MSVKVPETFTKNGYQYQQIERKGNFAIYQQTGQFGDIHFELVRIKKYKSDFYTKKVGDEFYPGNETWGADGFTFLSLEAAKQKLIELKNAKHHGI